MGPAEPEKVHLYLDLLRERDQLKLLESHYKSVDKDVLASRIRVVVDDEVPNNPIAAYMQARLRTTAWDMLAAAKEENRRRIMCLRDDLRTLWHGEETIR